MALEIERKYVVDPDLLPPAFRTGPRIVQCYLTPALDGGTAPEVRVRLAEGLPSGLTEGSITIKLRGIAQVAQRAAQASGMRYCGPEMRQEYEAILPSADAEEIIKSGCGQIVRKMRSKVPVYLPVMEHLLDRMPAERLKCDAHNTHRLLCYLEIDVYTDDNAGLCIAELELPCADLIVPPDCLPPYVRGECTGLPQYSNRVLAAVPYTHWNIADRGTHRALIAAGEVRQ